MEMRSPIDELRFQVGQLEVFWRRFRRHKAAVVSLGIAICMIVMAFAPSLFATHDPRKLDATKAVKGPSLDHPMGTDQMGRDIYSRVIYGTRTSVIVGICATVITTILGFAVGTYSGYIGRIVDDILMRITESILVMPWFFLMLLIVIFFGQSLWNIVWVIGITSWPQTARVVRSEVLSLKERGFVEAARSTGCTDFRIIVRHIAPNVMPSVIVSATLMVSQAVLTESYLSFLGVGDPNVISWGQMLMTALVFMRTAWWMPVFPGLAIFIIVLAFNMIGDGLNDALNPRLKGG